MKSFQFQSVIKLHWVFKATSVQVKQHLELALKQSQLHYGNKTFHDECQSYTVSDKLRIIQLAEQNSNCAAEHEIGVSESNVGLWRKSRENLKKMPRLKRANHGKKAERPELEVNLLEWIIKIRHNSLSILPSLVRLKALELAKNKKCSIPDGYKCAHSVHGRPTLKDEERFSELVGLQTLREISLWANIYEWTFHRETCYINWVM